MPNLAVIGGQWGDEGKGKVVDLLSASFDVVARFQGGPNAGHTVTIGERRHALHHVPSGVFRPGVRAVIGNGAVLDLARLIEELESLRAAGVELDGRLFISDRAHVILPVQRQLDALSETQADGAERIGTTQRGIGPTYEAKAARWGVRMGDLAEREHLERRLNRILDGPVGLWLRANGQEPQAAEACAAEARRHWERLAPFVTDTVVLLNRWIDEGLRVLFEGAQGTLLDVDHGSYPYVTSSSTTAGGVCAGLGIAPRLIDGVVGVFKAYATRVGAGPMPTELTGGDGDRLRERGREYGTTTGRPRRCGWFDAVAARYACRLNRYDAACVMLLDVLDAFDEIRVCTAYELDGRLIEDVPASTAQAARIVPQWETLPGWRSDTTAVRRWQELPAAAQRYLERLAGLIGAEVCLVGVGPERAQSLVRPDSWLAAQLAR